MMVQLKVKSVEEELLLIAQVSFVPVGYPGMYERVSLYRKREDGAFVLSYDSFNAEKNKEDKVFWESDSEKKTDILTIYEAAVEEATVENKKSIAFERRKGV